jgi:purine-binding chemotaxis protein CheW
MIGLFSDRQSELNADQIAMEEAIDVLNDTQPLRDFTLAGIEGGFSLLCRVGTVHCALPLEHVIETMRPVPLETLPGLPYFVGGIGIVRGVPLAVVIVNRLFAKAEGRPERLVIARVGERRVGFAVDTVIGVLALDGSMLQRLPRLLLEAPQDAVAAIGTLDGELLVVLQTARIVPPEVFSAVEAKAAES